MLSSLCAEYLKEGMYCAPSQAPLQPLNVLGVPRLRLLPKPTFVGLRPVLVGAGMRRINSRLRTLLPIFKSILARLSPPPFIYYYVMYFLRVKRNKQLN